MSLVKNGTAADDEINTVKRQCVLYRENIYIFFFISTQTM